LRSIAKASGVRHLIVFQYLEHYLLSVAAKFPSKSGAQYVRHRPEQTALYQLIQQHAAVRCHVNERLKLERLCRYITRSALANDRVKINAKGQVELKLKTPWRDGTTHHVMSPLEFMQRLAALVPRPRLHLIRFHGVLAPNAKWRSKVVPRPSEALSH
jgi:hypothetical protein